MQLRKQAAGAAKVRRKRRLTLSATWSDVVQHITLEGAIKQAFYSTVGNGWFQLLSPLCT